MRILNRTDFLDLPSGTVYAKYEPCFFSEFAIKGDTYRLEDGSAIDWASQCLSSPHFTTANDSGEWMYTLTRIEEGEASPPLDWDIMGRDGCFDQGQLFAVFEAADLDGLIDRLIDARREGYADDRHMADGLQLMDDVRRALTRYYEALGCPDAARRAYEANSMRELLYDAMESPLANKRLADAGQQGAHERAEFARARAKFG